MRKLLLFALYFVFTTYCMAQSTLLDGYIITLEKDTVFGKITYTDDKVNNRQCLFIPANEYSVIKYHPGEIHGYRFKDGNYYVSKNIAIDKDSITVFLEFIVEGEVDLYYYAGEKLPVYFVQKEGEKLFLLKGGEKTVTKLYDNLAQSTYKVDDDQYKGALIYYLQDLPGIQQKAYGLNLNHKELIKLSEEYHTYKCSDKKCIVYEKQKLNRLKVALGIFSGYNSSTIDKLFDIYYEPKIFITNGYIAGFTADLFYDKNSGHSFTTLNFAFGNNNYKSGEETYSDNFISLGVHINYRFLTKKVSPYVGIGLEYDQFNCEFDGFSRYSGCSYRKKVLATVGTFGMLWNVNSRYTIKTELNYSNHNLNLGESVLGDNISTLTNQLNVLLKAQILLGKID